jgi:acyl-CoA synthetase (AMP-forming)/AMP-acid ligase II
MTPAPGSATTLLGLVHVIPAEQLAVIAPEQNIRLTYGGLRKQVQTIAELLAAAGVQRGDRVGIALPNGIPNIVTFLAASVAGTAAPLNPGYKEDEFKFYLDDTNARVLILPPNGNEEARKAAGDRVPILTVDMDENGNVSLRGVTNSRPVPAPDVDDVALILHTSGRTGRPKRVPLTHANLSISAGNVARSYSLSGSDVSLCVMPLFDLHGLVASTLATLATGGTIVVPTEFNPLSFWRIVRDHKVTWYSAVPTIHQLLLAGAEKGAAKPAGAENLRFIRSCSASLPPQVMHDLEQAFGAPVLEAYGMTEAAHQMASNPLPPAMRLPGSVGRCTDVQISIMDSQGRHLPAGERGEVVISGPNVVRGYENNPEANAVSFIGGWFRTGDQGFLDENGYLTLTGRLSFAQDVDVAGFRGRPADGA